MFDWRSIYNYRSPFIIVLTSMFPLQRTCSSFTNIQIYTRACVHTHFIYHLCISLPFRANGEFVFKGLFTTHTHTHSVSQPHTCARSSRVAFNSSLRHGWSIACLVCVCVYVCGSGSLTLPVSVYPLTCAWLHGCVCVHVPPLIIFSFDNA